MINAKKQNLTSLEGLIEYIDVYSLYAWALRNKLPKRNFRFIDVQSFIVEFTTIQNIRCDEHVNMNNNCYNCVNSILNLKKE